MATTKRKTKKASGGRVAIDEEGGVEILAPNDIDILADRKELTPFHIAEFAAMRQAILKRYEFMYQSLFGALVIAGSLLTVFWQSSNDSAFKILYAVAPLLCALSSLWSYNWRIILAGSNYIYEHIEKAHDIKGWEHFLRDSQDISKAFIGLRLAAIGVFAILQLPPLITLGGLYTWHPKMTLTWKLGFIAELTLPFLTGYVIWVKSFATNLLNKTQKTSK